MPPFLPPQLVPAVPRWITEALARYAKDTRGFTLDREVTLEALRHDPDTGGTAVQKLPAGLRNAIEDLDGQTITLADTIYWIRSSFPDDEHRKVQVDIEVDDRNANGLPWLTCTIVEDNRLLRHIRLLRFREV